MIGIIAPVVACQERQLCHEFCNVPSRMNIGVTVAIFETSRISFGIRASTLISVPPRILAPNGWRMRSLFSDSVHERLNLNQLSGRGRYTERHPLLESCSVITGATSKSFRTIYWLDE